jgi:hypothetical protein
VRGLAQELVEAEKLVLDGAQFLVQGRDQRRVAPRRGENRGTAELSLIHV